MVQRLRCHTSNAGCAGSNPGQITKIPHAPWPKIKNKKRVGNYCIAQGTIFNLFNLYAEYIMRNAGLEEAPAGIKIVGRNINNLR